MPFKTEICPPAQPQEPVSCVKKWQCDLVLHSAPAEVGFTFHLNFVQLVGIFTLFWTCFSCSEGAAFSGHKSSPIDQQYNVGCCFLRGGQIICHYRQTQTWRLWTSGKGPGAVCRAVHQCTVCQNKRDLWATAAPTPVSWWGTKKCSQWHPHQGPLQRFHKCVTAVKGI